MGGVAGGGGEVTEAAAGRGVSLAERASRLVAIPSVSGNEAAIADFVEAAARRLPGEVLRVSHTIVHRTPPRGRPLLVLAGHLDTVPGQGNETPRLAGGQLSGLGACDMKGGVAVQMALAEALAGRPARFDLAFVYYECEEVALSRNGLKKLWEPCPWLASADLAILLEPTGCAVELGCQGTLHAQITVAGRSAHSARPWLGENAVYKALPLLAKLAAIPSAPVELDGVTYRETVQVTEARAGQGKNVIPASFVLNVNYRYAPNRTPESAAAVARGWATDGETVEIVDVAPPAPPRREHRQVGEFASRFGLTVRGKQGWTDVAQFAERGIAAFNFGPGNPELAHRADEFVEVEEIERAFTVLEAFCTEEPK